jgi:DNA excision repair protein ERCC-1
VSTPESHRRIHSQCPQGVWRHSTRLPSRQNDRSPLPQVPPSSIPPAERILRFWDHSLRYHRLHPEYIHQRIERLGQSYNLRILLLMCDIVRPLPLSPSSPRPKRFPVRTPRTDSRTHKGLSSQQHHSHRSLVVSPLPSSTDRRANEFTHTSTQRTCWCWWWWMSHNSVDEAGQYLTAYKQSEHRQPTLIRERVDKTPSALLRTALTSIPRVNKTDVETLRASFGVRPLFPISSP